MTEPILQESRRAECLLPLVYNELRTLAHAQMARESKDLTLEPTALVHEAYVRLVGTRNVQWDGRGHFFGAAATAMRRILVERARKHQVRIKAREFLEIEERAAVDSKEMIVLDEALNKLEKLDEAKYRIVMLRHFAGLTIEETANALRISPMSVKRAWRFARAWLEDEIRERR